jgi:hypothetical protein
MDAGDENMTDQQVTQRAGTGQNAEEVFRILKKASYFIVSGVPDPESLSVGFPLISFIPFLIYKIEVTESPHRIQISVKPPSVSCGFRTEKKISRDHSASQHFFMQPVPNNFESGPGRQPPLTVLLPFVSQRFWMYDGDFEFHDGRGSGFSAIAAGRFFPATVAGTSGLRFGAVTELLDCRGQLQGLIGNMVVNGYTRPPAQFTNNLIFRFVDVGGRLTSDTLIQPVIPWEPDPDPDSAYIPLMAELHPDYPVVIEPAPDGKRKQVHLLERLRLVDSLFDVQSGFLKSRTTEKEVVGERRTTLIFDPDDINQVIPLFSSNSVFTFFADGGTPIGTLKANLFEGRAFRTSLPELEQPFFRIGGYGPLQEGTGQFKDTVGMITVNGALSLTPAALSSMYMVRILDPLCRFQPLGPRGLGREK